MPTESTQAAARDQLHRCFIRTLRMLPPELALALYNPELPLAHFHNGVVLPCNDNGDVVLQFFDISYWITGTTPNSINSCFELVVWAWNYYGWRTRTDQNSRPRTAFTQTPDYYELTLQQSINGYLSISGSTPPFSLDSIEGNPLPQLIEHPLSTGRTQPRNLGCR